MLMAALASWPTTRNRVAAVYTAASAGPRMTATSTMSSRWMTICATEASARGAVNRQNPPVLASTGALVAGVSVVDDPVVDDPVVDDSVTGWPVPRRRWIRRSHSQAATPAGTYGRAQSGASRAVLLASTAASTPAACRQERPTRSTAT